MVLKYTVCTKAIPNAGFTVFSHHQWYFSEETVALEFSNKSIDTALKVASDFATEAHVRFCSKPRLIGMTVRGCRTAVNAVVNCGTCLKVVNGFAESGVVTIQGFNTVDPT